MVQRTRTRERSTWLNLYDYYYPSAMYAQRYTGQTTKRHHLLAGEKWCKLALSDNKMIALEPGSRASNCRGSHRFNPTKSRSTHSLPVSSVHPNQCSRRVEHADRWITRQSWASKADFLEHYHELQDDSTHLQNTVGSAWPWTERGRGRLSLLQRDTGCRFVRCIE